METVVSIETYKEIAKKIIQEQQMIMGPVAIEEANKVNGLKVSSDLSTVEMLGSEIEIVEKLVEQYAILFGKVSVEISKEAVRPLIKELTPVQVPDLLRF